jgi:hypothetical protein
LSGCDWGATWTVEEVAGGLKVCDANSQSLAYVYSRENPNDAHMAKVLTADELGVRYPKPDPARVYKTYGRYGRIVLEGQTFGKLKVIEKAGHGT